MRRELQPVMEGARFVEVVTNRPDLRTPFPGDFAERLEGQTVRVLQRRGKYLLAELSSNEILVMHLGMSGSFRLNADADIADSHDHVIFRMSSGATVVFNDPRRFGFMELISRDGLSGPHGVEQLGPEPLSNEFNATTLARACRGKKASLKAALSDQRVVAGLGNIYVAEALHRARLSPRRRASSIATPGGRPRAAAVRLTAAIKRVLHEAIAAIGSGPRAASFDYCCRVYDREGARCPRRGCGGVIRRITQTGRSTFFCPGCQR